MAINPSLFGDLSGNDGKILVGKGNQFLTIAGDGREPGPLFFILILIAFVKG
jgi:hypothetical protein